MLSRFPRFLRYALISLAALFVLAGVLWLGFRLAVSRVPEYRVQLQEWVSEKAGLAIEFSGIRARLRAYGPELVFDDAVVRTVDRTRVLATARRGSVGFDFWTSLSQRRLIAGRFTLDSPEIALIRTREGRIRLLGQAEEQSQQENKPIALDSLPVGEFRVRDAVVSFRDEITRRGPWSMSGITFTLSRQNDLLELAGSAALPRALGESLEFSARVDGVLANVDELTSTFSLEAEGLDLAGWADVMPNQWIVPETGQGSLHVATSFNGTQPRSITARLDFRGVSAVAPEWTTPLPQAEALQPPKEDEETDIVEEALATTESVEPTTGDDKHTAAESLISFDRLALTFDAKRQDDTWNASLTDLDLSRRDSPWQSKKISASVKRADDGALDAEVTADRIVLENLWPLLAFAPETASTAKVRALQARGTIENLTARVAQSVGVASAFSIKADITNGGVRPVLRNAGVSGVSAHVEGDEKGGVVRLDAKDVTFELPRMFRAPLHAQSASGDVRWERLQDAWRFASDELHVTTPDGNAQGRIAVTVPMDRSRSPILDLEATADDLLASSAPKYMPANKLSAKALGWLDHAFVAGRVRDAHVIFKGPTRAVPFRRGEGEFIARARIEDGTLNYQPGWEHALQLATRFEFRNQGMRTFDGTAQVGGLHVSKISSKLPDFKKGQLDISAQAEGDLGHGLALLQGSPLREALGTQFNALRGKGGMHSDMSLHLPFKRLADRRVFVVTRVNDATVESEGLAAPVTGLNGSLTVRQTLPEAAQLNGVWLGAPLDVSIEPLAGAPHASRLVATGHADAERLQTLMKLPASVKFSGAADWRLSTDLTAKRPEDPPARQQPRKFVLESNLRGFGIGLPYPVGKTEPEARSLRAEIDFDGENEILARTSLGSVRSLLRMEKRNEAWRFDRGGIRAGGSPAALPAHPGLRIDGALDRLVLDDWFALRSDTPGKTRVSDFLKAADLDVGTLQVFGYQFPDVHGVLRTQDGAWKVDVAGPSALGELSIPEDFASSQVLTMRLDRLVVSREDKRPTPSQGRDPRSWPNLHAYVGDFRYQDRSIGSLDLSATRVPQGIRIDSLAIVQQAVRADAHAEWLVTPAGQRSTMTAKIASTDVGASLRALNYTPALDAKHGEISAQLTWPGGFDGDFMARSSGTVTVSAEDGELLSVDPGAGRMLGLFSVAALPRRLALDFSDLTSEGLAFDALQGDFELRDGNAYTSNLVLRGPAAEIGIAGRTGLGAHDYDQTAVVTGELGVTLPVAGVLAGGPAVGAALLLFSQVFKEPLKGMTRGYYRITGPWDNPVVERVDASQIKEAASSAHPGSPR